MKISNQSSKCPPFKNLKSNITPKNKPEGKKAIENRKRKKSETKSGSLKDF